MPILRDVIDQQKAQNNDSRKTIDVADKGLNSAQNIAFSRKNGDRYLFQNQLKDILRQKKTWVLLDKGLTDVKDKKGKLPYRYKTCIDDFPYKVEHKSKEYIIKLKEKRLLTYAPSLAAKKDMRSAGWSKRQKPRQLPMQKKSQFGEAGKYVNFTDESGNKASVSINQKAIEKDL